MRPRGGVLSAVLVLVSALTVAMASTPAAGSENVSGASSTTSSQWVKDTTHNLDIWLPDANSDYYLGGYGTKSGARTIIRGQVPDARYWSFTAYPLPSGTEGAEIHDTQIARLRGRYQITIAASCRGVRGTCLATPRTDPSGVVVLRLYVPVDLHGEGTGGVPLPSISYVSAGGAPISLTTAAGTPAIATALEGYANEHGALPAALTQKYPPPAPVPTPIRLPPPVAAVSHGKGKFNNPDSIYVHVRYTTTRGNLVASALPPTFQADGNRSVNNLARPASKSPQVRYWSLCIVLEGLHTGDCLRDQQVYLNPGSRRFTTIVSPTCPVAGYRNCLLAGPQPLQVSLAYRYVLPSNSFKPNAFRGPYALTATYVGRPQ
jgi:hypothetical protein